MHDRPLQPLCSWCLRGQGEQIWWRSRGPFHWPKDWKALSHCEARHHLWLNYRALGVATHSPPSINSSDNKQISAARFLEVVAGDWGRVCVCVCVCVCVAVALGEFLLLCVEWIDFDEKTKIRQGTAGVAEEKSAVILLTVFMMWGVCVCRDWIGDLGGVAVHHGYHWNICVFFLSLKMVERPIPCLLYFFFLIFIWLRWVLVAAHGIFVAVCEISLQHIDSNGGTPISSCSERAPEPHGFSSCSVRALKLWCVGSVVAPSQMGSLFPNRGSNPRPLHCKVSS